MTIATEGLFVGHRRGNVLDERATLEVQDNIDRRVSCDEVGTQSREDLLIRGRWVEVIIELTLSTVLYRDRALGAIIEGTSSLRRLRIVEFVHLSIELERHIDTGTIVDGLRIRLA